ncbi:MAG: hypothetical protein QM533_11375 [Cytophagales bacterium]|nr:hypothetical protein [Cytophagales bacterium]
MWSKKFILPVLWPAFLVASLLEMFVFMLFDPHDANWLGQPSQLSRQGIYSVSFFVFWGLGALASALSIFLLRKNIDD